MKIRLVNAPDEYFTLLEGDIRHQVVKNGTADFTQLFARNRVELATAFAHLIKELPPNAIMGSPGAV